MPASAVVVTNTGTGIKNNTRTSAEGYYTVPFLDPGYYEISVTMSGFKTTTRSGIKLDLGQVARIDFRLDVGTQSEQVVVTSTAPLVQSETASQGQVIGEAAVVDLPLNGRNFTQLTTLTPGAYTGPQTNFTKGSTVTVNGMRASNTAYVVNGINTTDQDYEGTAILPPPDAIQEFKVQTNNLGSQYGLGGAVISLELKSGTNALHGGAVRVLAQRQAGRAELFRAIGADFEAEPVRVRGGRSGDQGPHVLLRRLPGHAGAQRADVQFGGGHFGDEGGGFRGAEDDQGPALGAGVSEQSHSG